MRNILFTLICCASAVAVAATVYKWVDESGVVHYSDQPHQNAQKVELKAPQTYSAPKTSAPAPASTKAPPKTGTVYQSCSIAEPASEQMLMNTASVNASVSTDPAVRQGDTAIVTMDGQRVPGVPANGGQFTISPVDRGTHSIQVVIQDAQGNPVCQSAAVTFYVHQPSLQNPKAPVRPH
jgi:hypothetical protein